MKCRHCLEGFYENRTTGHFVHDRAVLRDPNFGRAAVLEDYRLAIEEDGVQGIPTVIVAETGERVIGLTDLESYRRVVKAAAG